MYLLLFLELMIGDVSTWPRDISALFIEPPTTPNVMKVSAFFYGSGVPVKCPVIYSICVICMGA